MLGFVDGQMQLVFRCTRWHLTSGRDAFQDHSALISRWICPAVAHLPSYINQLHVAFAFPLACVGREVVLVHRSHMTQAQPSSLRTFYIIVA